MREKLVACHSHSNRRFSYCGIDAHDPCVGVAHNWQQRVQHKRNDGQAISACSQPWSGQKKPEQRQTRNGLQNVRSAQDRFTQPWIAAHEDSKRNANNHGKSHSNAHEPQMLERERGDLASVPDEEVEHIRSATPLPELTDRMGWLTLPDSMQQHVKDLESFSKEIKDAGYRYIVLLGMGGFRRRRCRSRNSFCNSARVIGSSAPKGSSISRMRGSAASALATPTRCRWPPES